MLVNPNVDLRSLDKECHVAPTEREQIDKIKGDFIYYCDIIDHGYTGLIKEDMIDDIIGSIVVWIVSRKLLPYSEIKEGFKAYGLKDLLLNHSELCRPLFVRRPLTGLLVPEAKLILHEQRLVSVKQQPACLCP